MSRKNPMAIKFREISNMTEEEKHAEFKKCKDECISLREKIDNMKSNVHKKLLSNEAISQELSPLNVELNVTKYFEGHKGKIYSTHWSHDSSLIASAAQDGNIIIWESKSKEKIQTIKLSSNWVMACAFSPSARYVACGGLDNLCSIYNISSHEHSPYRQLQAHEGYLSGLSWVNDDKIVTASGDTTCILWDVKKKIAQTHFLDHQGDVMSVKVCPETQNLFLSCSVDATIKLWDVREEKCVGHFTGNASDVNDIDWFPDNRAFASASDDATCRLFDTRAYRQLHVYCNEKTFSGVTSVSFSRSGRALFAGYDDEPFCMGWDVAFGDLLCKLYHNQRVQTVMVAPNGSAICTASWDQMLRLWTRSTLT